MEVIKEDEIRDEVTAGQSPKEEIKLEDITTDVENIQIECKKINCSPVMNVIKGIYKLFCHLIKCFKFKKE